MAVSRLGILSVALALAAPAAAQEHEHAGMAGEKLGTVHFATSCSAAAQPQFDRAVALMHSFEFGPAIDGYTAAANTDPGCAMAYWGIALEPLGQSVRRRPAARAQLQQGLDAIGRAKQAGAKTERERDYIAAAERLYADYDKMSQRDRVVAYEHAMADLAAKYPEDREASIFYALSLAASALPTDKTYANQLKAGAILEKISPKSPTIPASRTTSFTATTCRRSPLARRERRAPVWDDRALGPHALHMPSHTFTRVGFWQESIDANIASAAAAQREHAVGDQAPPAATSPSRRRHAGPGR